MPAGAVAVLLCLASACGSSFAGDCSGGTADGAGNCIPYDHGPTVAQQAAFSHFGDRAEQVACLNNGPFRYRDVRYHQYDCFAIRGGHMQRGDDDRYCVIVRAGAAIPDQQVTAILAVRPAQRHRCTG